MATILDAVRLEVLKVFAVPDWDSRLPARPLYVAPQLWTQIDNEPRAHVETAKLGGRSPYEHLDAIFTDFRCGEKAIGNDQLKRLMPTTKGVWEMHPPGLRVFGWCPAPYEFVAVSVAIVEDLKADHDLYNQHRDGVLAFAKRHDLSSTITLGDYSVLFPPNR